MKYNILFVPHLSARKKITPLRARLSRQSKSNKALQYPVHMSLISGGLQTSNIKELEKDLVEFCSKLEPFQLKPFKRTDVLKDINWTGIHIKGSAKVDGIRKDLQRIRNKHAKNPQQHFFKPLHITCSFEADVSKVKPEKTPVSSLLFDRITVTKKAKKGEKYFIYKHFYFSKQ